MSLRERIAGGLTGALVIGALAGLFLPGLESVPKITVLFLIAGLIFMSCSKIELKDLRSFSAAQVAVFYAARFLVFPVLLFLAARALIPAYAPSVLLLSLMPSGSASAAITGILRGNVALSLSMTVVSTLLAPFVVPLMFWLAGGQAIEIDLMSMFVTLCLVVFLPIGFYFGAAGRVLAVKTSMQANAGWVSVVLIFLLVALTIALRREYFFSNFAVLFAALAVICVLYVLYYAAGWVAAARFGRAERVSLMVCSGANNNTLAASLALLYFSPLETLCMIVSEVPWGLGVMAARWLAKEKAK